MTSLNACPGLLGDNGDKGLSESCRTNTTGHDSDRHKRTRAAILPSHDGLSRGPQNSASSNPACTSTTIRAGLRRSICAAPMRPRIRRGSYCRISNSTGCTPPQSRQCRFCWRETQLDEPSQIPADCLFGRWKRVQGLDAAPVQGLHSGRRADKTIKRPVSPCRIRCCKRHVLSSHA